MGRARGEARGRAWSPRNRNDGERERKREKKGGGETRGQENLGGAEELFPPEPASFSVTYARRSGGKKPNKAFFFSFQYFSFLGTSQGKLSLPKWP